MLLLLFLCGLASILLPKSGSISRGMQFRSVHQHGEAIHLHDGKRQGSGRVRQNSGRVLAGPHARLAKCQVQNDCQSQEGLVKSTIGLTKLSISEECRTEFE